MQQHAINLIKHAAVLLKPCVLLFALTAHNLVHAQALGESERNPIQDEIANHFSDLNYAGWAPDLNWAQLRDFYSAREYRAAWSLSDQPQPYAKSFLDALVNAEFEGLEPNEYHLPVIRFLWSAHKPISKARLDILLTDAFFRYAVEVQVGYQYPRSVDYEWYIRPSKVEPVKLLNDALASGNLTELVGKLPPQHEGYSKLRDALIHYQQMKTKGEWGAVPSGKSLRLGSWNPRVAQLRERLQREDYLTTSRVTDLKLFDEQLDQAVRDYQQRNGQKLDGVVGRETLHSLNVPLASRIDQIKQNMERWRWLPKTLGERYVLVNMAGYRLYLIDRGVTTLDMRVIIGKPYKATPAFRDNITYLELNPKWNVPTRIAGEDILPKVLLDPLYLKTHNIRVYENWKNDAEELDSEEINWSEINAEKFPYRLTQDPGNNNSLGRIKIMFPNSFNVYLHDTPSRNLFNRNVRTFSSGCIRVERPIALAEQLLKDKGWSKRAIRNSIREGNTVRLDLRKPVPIYLVYWTAWVDGSGNLNFREDIYDRNENIAGTTVINNTPAL